MPSSSRLTKPAKAHNPLFAPATCLCVECSRKVLALRCPATTVNPHMQGAALQCGNFKGHRGDHTMLVATTFVIAEERVGSMPDLTGGSCPVPERHANARSRWLP